MSLINSKVLTFLDLETTSLDSENSRILEVGILSMFLEKGTHSLWGTKINSSVEGASKESLEIVGYDPELWRGAPTLSEAFPEIRKRLAFGPVIAHNAIFDIRHLVASLIREGFEETDDAKLMKDNPKLFKIGYPVICSASLAWLFLDTPKTNLQYLKDLLDIKGDFKAHSAIGDVELLSKVFIEMMSRIAGDKK